MAGEFSVDAAHNALLNDATAPGKIAESLTPFAGMMTGAC